MGIHIKIDGVWWDTLPGDWLGGRILYESEMLDRGICPTPWVGLSVDSRSDWVARYIKGGRKKREPLKAYLWEGKDVLQRYGTGKVMVLARGVEEAREWVRKEIPRKTRDWMFGDDGVILPHYFDEVFWDEVIAMEKDLNKWLEREPQVMDLQDGLMFWKEGSD